MREGSSLRRRSGVLYICELKNNIFVLLDLYVMYSETNQEEVRIAQYMLQHLLEDTINLVLFLKIYFHSVYMHLLPACMSAPHVHSQRPGEGVVHSGTAVWVLRIKTRSSAIAKNRLAPAC